MKSSFTINIDFFKGFLLLLQVRSITIAWKIFKMRAITENGCKKNVMQVDFKCKY